MSKKRIRSSTIAVAALLMLRMIQAAHADTAGIAAPGSIDYPKGGMRRVGKVKLSTPNVFRSLYGGVIDTVHGYAYFSPAATVNPGWVIKVNINGPLPVEVGAAQCGSGDFNLLSGVVDSTAGYGYFGGLGSPGRVVKMRLEPGDATPTYLGSTPLSAGPAPPAENNVFGMVADFANGHIFCGTNTSPGNVVKVDPGLLDALPTRINAVQLDPGENNVRRTVIDTVHGYAYFTKISAPSPVVIKVALGPGNSPPVRVGAAALDAMEGNIGSAVIDVANGYAYFGTYNQTVVPARVVKVALGDGDVPPVRVNALTLNTGERELSTGVIDTNAGYAFFGSDHIHPAKIFKVKLGAGDDVPTETGVLQLNPGSCGTACYPPDGGNISSADPDLYGELYLQSSVIDLAKGFAYFGTDTNPGQVVKVAVAQQGAIKGTRIVVNDAAHVNSISFYSHAASGHVRLAIYDDSASRKLLWESGLILNTTTDGWITVPIDSGAPSSLALVPENYWLAWQVDSTLDIPSHMVGADGDGFLVETDFAPFLSTLPSVIGTTERWSIYLTLNSAILTPTPIVSPTPYDGRPLGDFDSSQCTDLSDFLFLLDFWQLLSPIGAPMIDLTDFLNLLDHWQLGNGC